MPFFTDQCNNTIELNRLPNRIVSLVPSQTELFADLDLESKVVGITKFCIHPDSWKKKKTIVGGTKKFDFAVIDQLQPDLIIGNKEENYKEGIETLQKRYAVWMSDIFNLSDALKMIEQVGMMCDRKDEAILIANDIHDRFAEVRKRELRSVLYLIWKGPYMAAGKNTFIDSMLETIGLTNAVTATRYPVLTETDIIRLAPEIVMLSSEPFPFRDKHVNELNALLPGARIILVDGEMFSWYGSRLRLAPDYYNALGI